MREAVQYHPVTMNLRQFLLVIGVSFPLQGALIELDLGPVNGTGAGMHWENTLSRMISGGTGGELNTRNPLAGGITYDTVNKAIELNIGWGTDYGFTDLEGIPNRLEFGGPTSVPNSEGDTIYSLFPGHPGFSGEEGRDGSFSWTVPLVANPGSLTYSIAEQEADLLAGLWYLNLRTSTHLSGEIRGQLTAVPEPGEYAVIGGLLLVGFAGVQRWRGRRSENRAGS